MASSGRRRSVGRQNTVEEQTFDIIAREGEEKLAQRRIQRKEAQAIRTREIERRQREMEETQDRLYEITKDSAIRSYTNSRTRENNGSLPEEVERELEMYKEKYEKAMLNNAQLENEKQTYRYQVDLLKDDLEELEENHNEANRLLKERYRDLELRRRDCDDLHLEVQYLKMQIEQRDQLIRDYGLVFISNESVEEESEGKDDKKSKWKKRRQQQNKGEEEAHSHAALVTPDALQILNKVEGNLDEKLKALQTEKEDLSSQVRTLTLKVEEMEERAQLAEKFASPKREGGRTQNGPVNESDSSELNTEAQKQLTEYRYKLKKAEQDITVLEGNVLRLESQVKRYKGASEEAESSVEEMKSEKRKIQKEIRDKQNEIDELQSQNSHLQKRLEKFRKERLDAIATGKS